VDPAYGERYRQLFEHHWWWRAREDVVLRELEQARPEGGWSRALDVGCGDGLFLAALGRHAAAVEGVEPDEAIVSDGTRRSGLVHVAPFDTRFRPDHRYDLVLFLDVVEHIEDASAALAHAADLMEPGGTLVVTVPAFMHLWTTHDDLNLHVTRYTKRGLHALLSERFVVDRTRYFFHWVYFGKLAQRGAEWVRRPDPSLPAIPAAPVNQLMLALSRIEERLLMRVPLPFGSSLLAVAHKRAGRIPS
jgi:SAM-dependent methyltransferase